METLTAFTVGGLCRGKEFNDPRQRDRYGVGTTWSCPFSATVKLPDGDIVYGCAQEFTRLAVNTVRTLGDRACLEDVVRAHPTDWENHLCLPPTQNGSPQGVV